ncbi:MAG: NAD(P)/FAD-dependent oxidoreductase, partial [Mesorhizobium sp.]
SNAISFKPVDGKLKSVISFVSKVEESSEIRRQAARAAEGWYDAFTHDVFG